MGRILGGVAEWGILLVGIVGILGVGLSIPAAMAALVAWLLVGLLTAVTPWRDTPGAAAIVAAAVLCAVAGGALRYRRNVTVMRLLVTMLLAPVFAILAFVPMVVLATVAYAIVSSVRAGLAAGNLGAAFANVRVGFSQGIQSLLGVAEFVLMGMVWGAAITMVFTLVQVARQLFPRLRQR